MQSSGEDKVIRTLFHELKEEDLRATPIFDRQWAAAVAAQPDRSRPGFGFRWRAPVLALSSLCIVIGITIATVIIRRHQANFIAKAEQPLTVFSNTEPKVAVAEMERPPTGSLHTAPVAPEKLKAQSILPQRSTRKAPPHRLLPEQSATASLARTPRRPNQTALSRWQSPTAALLESPDMMLLNATPQINQSARNLKSFLPEQAK